MVLSLKARFRGVMRLGNLRFGNLRFGNLRFGMTVLALAISVVWLSSGSSVRAQSGLSQKSNSDCILDRCGDRADRRNRNFNRNHNYRSRDRFRDNNRRGRNSKNFDRRGRDYGNRNNRGRRGDRNSGGRNYGARPGQFDFYVLALSWSPTYCNSQAGRRSRNQCRVGANLRFVVHGLWPQHERGSPSYCDERNPPRSAVEKARGVFPELGLARYQWRKHGSCSGLSPSAYFDAVRKARNSVVVPPSLQKINRGAKADPSLIEKAFLAANKKLRADMIAVTCKRGQLQEVRVCLSKDLRGFVRCGEVDRRACRSSSVSIPPPR